VHVNGQSGTGYVLSLIAALVGRIAGRPVVLSWRGGLQQRYFPRSRPCWTRWAYQVLFRLSGSILCNSAPVKEAIEQYGVIPERVVAIPAFSSRHLEFQEVPLDRETQAFLLTHHPVFFCYVSFRPEYRLAVLQQAMSQFRRVHQHAGFIWLGFPAKEMEAVTDFVNQWPQMERRGLLLLGNLNHDEFLTLLGHCTAYIRTPVCDGVSSSVLESLALRVPVVASQNGYRPHGVITYREMEAADLCAKLIEVTRDHHRIKEEIQRPSSDDSIGKTVDWLLAGSDTSAQRPEGSLSHVA
jgi:glycosyltransferase involved in cell wall biosynthesis